MSNTSNDKPVNAGIAIGRKDRGFNALSFVVAARSSDPARFHMNGVYIGEEDGHLLFASTDGRRLHLYRDESDFLKLALESSGVDTKAITGHNFGVKKTADMLIIGAEYAGQFPNWRKVYDSCERKPDAVSVTFTKGTDYTDGVYAVHRSGFAAKLGHLADLYKHGQDWDFYAPAKDGGAGLFASKDFDGGIMEALVMPMNFDDPLAKEAAETEAVPETVEADSEATDTETAIDTFTDEAPEQEAPAERNDKHEAEASDTEAEHVIETPAPEAVTPRLSWKEIQALPKSERKAYAKARNIEIAEHNRKVLEAFLNQDNAEDLAAEVNAYSPLASYSPSNFVLAVAHGTRDARSFLDWRKAGRKVKKGAKAVYLWKQSNGSFSPMPVFRYEDTEGDDVAYVPVGSLGYHKLYDVMRNIAA
jgi:hypothetical protein